MYCRSKLAGLRHALGSSYAKAAAGVVATGAAAILLDSYASQILPGASYFFSGVRDEALMEINFVLGFVSDSTFSTDGSGFISDHRPISYWAVWWRLKHPNI